MIDLRGSCGNKILRQERREPCQEERRSMDVYFRETWNHIRKTCRKRTSFKGIGESEKLDVSWREC